MTYSLGLLALEDVAGKLGQETLDGVTDGLKLFSCNVLVFVLGAPKSSNIEALTIRSPSCPRVSTRYRRARGWALPFE
jgi:hypothetical protein